MFQVSDKVRVSNPAFIYRSLLRSEDIIRTVRHNTPTGNVQYILSKYAGLYLESELERIEPNETTSTDGN